MSARTLSAPAQAVSPWTAIANWLHRHDPGYGALRRAVRAAIVMPCMFALGDAVIANPVLATFAAFGSFAMLLLVDYPGTIRDRLTSQASLGVACAVLICIGTLCGQASWLAVVGMGVVAFAVVFAGVVSSVLAGATTALLLAFILPVSFPGAVSTIPDRVAGWGLAAAASLLAISLLWPAPVHNPVRTAAIDACRALAERLRGEIEFILSDGDASARAAHDAVVSRADDAVERLHGAFFATPYRPTGLSTDARAVIRLVDELRWLNTIVLRSAPKLHPKTPNPHICRVKTAAAAVLDCAAAMLGHPDSDRLVMTASLEEMQAALLELQHDTTTVLPALAPADPRAEAREVISALDPSFRAQELSFVVTQIATNSAFAAAAERRSWLERLLGRQPEGLQGPLAAAQERAGSRVARHSLWLQNSVRAAVALALAVLVADLSSVQHGFWVAFATLSVLRSNALSTGQSTVRALLGTTGGFVVGGVIVSLVGTNAAVLWVLLPIAVLIAGMAPAMISFAAGQAGFTLTLLILFNILAPAGWRIGLVRVEDIAIGGAVSLAVGLLFWPRGAGAALGRALAEAYVASTRYLAAAVAYGASRGDRRGVESPVPREQAAAAAAAARRLDDTFRGYLSERGSKPIPMAEVTGLITGVVGVRLAADAVVDLWDGDGVVGGDRSAARRELLSAADYMTRWYGHFAASLTLREPVPDPLAPDRVADGRLSEAVSEDLESSGGEETATGVRMIWTGDHLDAVRRLQELLVDPARAAVAYRSRTPLEELRHAARLTGRLPRLRG
jgi:uncharacterized membrane protein YccC